MSLVMRIYLGMGAMVALLLLVGGFAAFQTNSLSSTFVEYRTTAKESLLASDIMEDVFEARVAVYDYRLDKKQASLDLLHSNIAEVDEAFAEFSQMVGRYTGHDGLLEVATMLEEYATSMDRAAELQNRRDMLVDTATDTVLKALDQLSEVMMTALQDNDPVASSAAGLAVKHLLLGRLFMEKFLVSNDPKDSARGRRDRDRAPGSDQPVGRVAKPKAAGTDPGVDGGSGCLRRRHLGSGRGDSRAECIL